MVHNQKFELEDGATNIEVLVYRILIGSSVAQSTAAAEYIAAATASNQALWLRKLFVDLMERQEEVTIIYCGNKSIKDALNALFRIALYPLNRSLLIKLGAVPPLFSLVVKDGRVGIVEDATAVVAQIAGCEEREEAFLKAKGVGLVADLLDPSKGSSLRRKENAVCERDV
ncbi:U-box domain-containing protein 38-like [Ziziphus jujuba]|uniref:U-box domain-containing protein 38-like n=1 Tax=Ziziphus jujuba TaxID=326968 RepID=A0ABM4A2U1_ZIZJJ|nr:U-box domain-containing protein 38-like [Ziziphus jujuba]